MRLREIEILLVEDDVDNLELLSSFFEGEGARVVSARSIAAALHGSSERRVDIVVSDMELADGDGCTLLTQLKERDGGRALPAIAITGYSDAKWRVRAAECGFTRYAVKPFSLDQLAEWVAELSRACSSNVVSEASRHAEPSRDARALPRR